MRDLQTGHPFFGRFGLADYAQLQAYHAVHHRAQLGPTTAQLSS